MARLTIAAVGDIKFNTPLKPNPLYDLLRNSNLAAANLECPLTNHDVPADKIIAIKVPPSVAGRLPTLGLRVVSIANNHALDYGEKGLLDTLRYVTQKGIKIAGAGRDLKEALTPATIKAGPLNVAFLGVACTLPAGSAALENKPGIAPIRVHSALAVDAEEAQEQPGSSPFVHTYAVQDDLEAVMKAVRKAKAAADLVIVSIHWGVTPGWQPVFQGHLAEYQSPVGRGLIDAGADIILGHHPHVLNGMEVYRRGIIFYSLGHFIFQSKGVAEEKKGPPARSGRIDQSKLPAPASPYSKETKQAIVAAVKRLLDSPQAKESMIALIHVDVLKARKPKIIGAEIIPCMIDRDGEPVACNAEEAQNVLTRLKTYSEELGTWVRFAGQRGYIDIS